MYFQITVIYMNIGVVIYSRLFALFFAILINSGHLLTDFLQRSSTEERYQNYTRIVVFTVISGLSYCHFAFILGNFLSKLVKSSFYISPSQKFLFNSFFHFGIHNFHTAWFNQECVR